MLDDLKVLVALLPLIFSQSLLRPVLLAREAYLRRYVLQLPTHVHAFREQVRNTTEINVEVFDGSGIMLAKQLFVVVF